MPPKKAHTRGGGKSKQPPPVKQGRGGTSSKTKKRKSPPSSESGSEFEPDDNHRHHAKRGHTANMTAQAQGGGKAKLPAKAKRVTRKDEQSDGTEEEDDDDEDSERSTVEGDEGPPLDSPPSQDMDVMISLTQTATSREIRAKRYKAWASEQMKSFEEAFAIAPASPPEAHKETQKVKKVIEGCKAELEESKQAWKGVMRAIDQKTKGMNEMTESLKANCRDARGPVIAALQAAIGEAKGYDERLAATVAKAEALRDADIQSKTGAFRKRDDAGSFISSLRRLVKVAK